ncbi:MAG: hypothetical protein JO108_07520 [Acidobacteriaceae bacterium]|nr:hypothetical protein [Acidobacteriaceae bacterium]
MSDTIHFSDHVTITRVQGAALASFDTIVLTQSQMVFWKNDDDQPHWPKFSTGKTPPVLAYQVGPNATSGSVQPALALPGYDGSTPLPQGQASQANYTCSLHPGEAGVINIYADFYSQASQLPGASSGKKYSANLTIGGVPDFTFRVSNSSLPASLNVVIVNPLQGPALSGTPGPNDTGNFWFDLDCQDAAGNNVTQTFQVIVTP